VKNIGDGWKVALPHPNPLPKERALKADCFTVKGVVPDARKLSGLEQ
jgi:hypothetical protein